ncbi:uncharacterized protein LOC143021112 [Oratosquilla oratoria]|uniref:uncharacterized protein LOC143021112 n=1 Tax=Oratosquilla oratoria TaxID=337810 RepID=UPI003F760C25
MTQQDLNEILRWAEENNMALNGEKFELLRYGRQLDLKISTNYYCGQQEIIAKDVVKDLGVSMCSDASFSHHIIQATSKARHLAGWILRTFQTRSPRCMLTLWKSLVLPHLEYCCQLWSPQKVSEIMEIEGPQRTFTNKIHGLQELNYWERLKELQLFSLQRCRERYIIIYIWKELEKKVPNTGIQVTVHQRKGRLCYVRTTPGSTLNIKSRIHNSFLFSGPRLFNCILPQLRNMTGVSPDTFKKHLDIWLAKIPDQPPTPG